MFAAVAPPVMISSSELAVVDYLPRDIMAASRKTCVCRALASRLAIAASSSTPVLVRIRRLLTDKLKIGGVWRLEQASSVQL